MKKMIWNPLEAGLLILGIIISNTANSTVFQIMGDPAMQPIIYNFTEEFVPSGSNFTMVGPSGRVLSPGNSAKFPDGSNMLSTNDVVGVFDDSRICTDSSCTDIAMTLGSSTAFIGAPWAAHDIRVFAPGTYTVESCPGPIIAGIASDGSTNCDSYDTDITFTVNSGQLGAHILFDWNGNNNVDIINVWNINGIFTRPDPLAGSPLEGFIPENSRQFSLASAISGTPMVDGPFKGHSANFNLFLDGPLVSPVPVPAAVWLFGSGLIGLVGFARRKK